MKTKPYRRSLADSLRSGVKSIFGVSKKQYCILEHKIGSKYHQAGEQQEIIVDQVEIGRDAKCQVRFDEYFETVSRRHAAIVREGNHWKLVPLSQTNPTLLNGQKMQKEWFLQDGDEIQCAINGPKIGFIIPSGEKNTTGSIRLRRRLNLFGKQALQPYKRLIAVLMCIIILAAIAGVGYFFYQQKVNIVPDITMSELDDRNDDERYEEEAKEKQVDLSETKPIKATNKETPAEKEPVKEKQSKVIGTTQLRKKASEYLDRLGCPLMPDNENRVELQIVSIKKDDGDYKIRWDCGKSAQGNDAYMFSIMHFFDPDDLSKHYQPFTIENGKLNYSFKAGDEITWKEFRVNFEPKCQIIYLFFEGASASKGAPAEMLTEPLFFTFILGDKPELLEKTPRLANGIFDNYIK